MNRTLLVCGMLVLLFSSASGQDMAEKRRQQFENIKNLICSGEFRFDAVNVKPRIGPSIGLATINNYLEIKNDSVQAYLPYFGEVRIATYNTQGAIQMNDLLRGFQITIKEKKRNIQLRFLAGGAAGEHRVILQVGRSGWATMQVRSMARPTISYYGRIRPLRTSDVSK